VDSGGLTPDGEWKDLRLMGECGTKAHHDRLS
jgi:hypothetical protein